MKCLLDTHTLLWYATQPASLSVRARDILHNSSAELYVSAATSWEVVTKHKVNKLPTAEHLLQNYEAQLERAKITLLAIPSHHARIASAFPGKHDDPFDRILAAQAFLENLLLSNATQLDVYGPHRIS